MRHKTSFIFGILILLTTLACQFVTTPFYAGDELVSTPTLGSTQSVSNAANTSTSTPLPVQPEITLTQKALTNTPSPTMDPELTGPPCSEVE